MTALIDTVRAMVPNRRRQRAVPRIGAVSYLNSKPLIEGLREFAPSAQLQLDFPSRLADSLRVGELDVALIPSVEFFRNPGYVAVSDACVATRGAVLSVKLYSRVFPGEIRTLALDEGSRTSAALSRILLAERYGVLPQLQPLSLSASCEKFDADAVLLIGDRAMHEPAERFHTVWDLGEEWLRWTGLPFVFALWVARPEAVTAELETALSQARDLGIRRIPDIARREAPLLGITAELAENYLSQNLHFKLGSAELNGLKLFRQLAQAQGLAPQSNATTFASVPLCERHPSG